MEVNESGNMPPGYTPQFKAHSINHTNIEISSSTNSNPINNHTNGMNISLYLLKIVSYSVFSIRSI